MTTNYTTLPQNIQNDQTLPTGHTIYQHFPFQGSPKYSLIGHFWCRNIAPGNPARREQTVPCRPVVHPSVVLSKNSSVSGTLYSTLSAWKRKGFCSKILMRKKCAGKKIHWILSKYLHSEVSARMTNCWQAWLFSPLLIFLNMHVRIKKQEWELKNVLTIDFRKSEIKNMFYVRTFYIPRPLVSSFYFCIVYILLYFLFYFVKRQLIKTAETKFSEVSTIVFLFVKGRRKKVVLANSASSHYFAKSIFWHFEKMDDHRDHQESICFFVQCLAVANEQRASSEPVL
jgi:hypothetical protein